MKCEKCLSENESENCATASCGCPGSAEKNEANAENDSGRGSISVLPAELRRWNWGAFLLTWIWAISNRVWIGLIAFIPYVSIVIAFVLGAKGNQWAWQSRKWESVEHFRRVQRKWAFWGLGIFIAALIILLVGFLTCGD